MKIRQMLLAGVLTVLLVTCAWLGLLAQGRMEQPAPEQDYGLRITEICTKNESILADHGGKYRDYIELCNEGPEPVDLAGFVLTDGRIRSAPLEGPVLQPGQYWVLFLGDDVTGFALGAIGGDTLQLQDGSGRMVAQTNTAAMNADEVMLWQESGYRISRDASPGFANDEAGLQAFRSGEAVQALELTVSEVLTDNGSVLPDAAGRYSDLVELHNPGTADVRLAGWYLSDDPADRFRFRLPDVTIPAGGHLVIFCDGQDLWDGSEVHTNFGLAYGESLCLTDRQGRYVTLEVASAGQNRSTAWTQEGYAPMAATPGYPNTEEGLEAFLASRQDTDGALIISEVLLSSAGVPYEGTLTDAVEILNRSDRAVSTEGWYLSDGGDAVAYPLPKEKLQPGQVLVIPCSRETTGFGLGEGEQLRLTAPDHRWSAVTCVRTDGLSISLSDPAERSYTQAAVTLGYPNETKYEQQWLETVPGDGLQFSELMSNNESYLPGAYATTCDWVEVYNASEQTLELSDYYLSDDSGDLERCRLPEGQLKPGQYRVILLSKEQKNLPSGYAVLPVNLSAAGEQLYLSRNGEIADYVQLPALAPDTSWGRTEESALFLTLGKPSPGKANSTAAALSAAPVAVTAQGSYEDVKYLDVVLEGEGTIYYTTDATVPTTYSTRYTGPIRLKKTAVIRAICVEKGKRASEVLDLTYLINEGDGVSAVSIITEPGNLFSSKYGIYTLGEGVTGEYPYYDANYFQDWEYPATVTLLEEDGSCGFSQPCGIKIFGAYSRAYPKKSLACFFRGSYGASELEYPLFGEDSLDTYEAFVLRACGQDVFHARIRDEIVTSVAGELTSLSVQDYRPVVVYLNGQYYGIHFIREKLNEQYVAGHSNVKVEKVTLAEGEGEYCRPYQELLEYARSHDLSKQKYYDEICGMMDVQNYMEYIFSQIWIANMDNNNVKYFKAGSDPWSWILFDTDLSMHETSFDSVWFNLNPAGTGGGYVSTELINALLKNKTFREEFLRTGARLVNEVWTAENLLPRIDALAQTIRADMQKDCARWGTSFDSWQQEVQALKDFAANRTGYVVRSVQRYFDLSDKEMKELGYPEV